MAIIQEMGATLEAWRVAFGNVLPILPASPRFKRGVPLLTPSPNPEIVPMRINGFNEIDLPLSRPAFKALLKSDGRRHFVKPLIPDEPRAAVLRREARTSSRLVRPHARREICGRAGVDGSVLAVRKQVRGDEIEAGRLPT